MIQETTEKKTQVGGFKRIYNGLFYSIDGLKAAFQNEAAFRQEVLLALILVPTALFLPFSTLMKAIMIASVTLVLIVEVLNSAIEAIVDRISLEHHSLAKRAKDMGSAAVFLSLTNGVIIWGFCIYETFFT